MSEHGHVLARSNALIPWAHCAVCLVILNLHNLDKPCKGHARVTVRQETPDSKATQ